MREIHHYVGGAEKRGTSTRFGDVFNPNTGEVSARVNLATKSDVSAAIEQSAENMPQRPEPAQHHRGERAHQGPVALGQCREFRMGRGIEQLVEWPVAVQHAVKNIGSDPAGREPGRLRRFSTRRRDGVGHGPCLPRFEAGRMPP